MIKQCLQDQSRLLLPYGFAMLFKKSVYQIKKKNNKLVQSNLKNDCYKQQSAWGQL